MTELCEAAVRVCLVLLPCWARARSDSTHDATHRRHAVAPCARFLLYKNQAADGLRGHNPFLSRDGPLVACNSNILPLQRIIALR